MGYLGKDSFDGSREFDWEQGKGSHRLDCFIEIQETVHFTPFVHI
jgi:hypothetical protein